MRRSSLLASPRARVRRHPLAWTEGPHRGRRREQARQAWLHAGTSPACKATPRPSRCDRAMTNLNQAPVKATPLYAACQRGHTEVVTKLLAANADVSKADNWASRRSTSPV